MWSGEMLTRGDRFLEAGKSTLGKDDAPNGKKAGLLDFKPVFVGPRATLVGSVNFILDPSPLLIIHVEQRIGLKRVCKPCFRGMILLKMIPMDSQHKKERSKLGWQLAHLQSLRFFRNPGGRQLLNLVMSRI